MTIDHPKFEGDVPHSRSKIDDKFVDRVTNVRLWQADHKDETKHRHGPCLDKRGLLRQLKQIIKTSEIPNFTVHFIIGTIESVVAGTLKRRVRRSTRFRTRRKSNLTTFWLIRTSASSEQEIVGIRFVTEGSTRLSAVKKAIQQTDVARRTAKVRDDRRASAEESEPETDLESLNKQDMLSATYDKAHYEAMIGLRKARKELQHVTKPTRFYEK